MSSCNFNLTEELESFVTSRVASGRYADANAVVSSALRLLQREQREYDEKMATLKAAIQEGLDSGVAEGDVFAELFTYIGELAVEAEKEQNLAGV